jgi:hypothetical protein
LETIFPNTVCRWSYLYSHPNCPQQPFHSDGKSNKGHSSSLSSNNILSFSVIAALQDNTTITLIDHTRQMKFVVPIPKGSIFIFPSTFEHAGSEYVIANLRVFLSMDINGNAFDPQSQDWTETQVDDPLFNDYDTRYVKYLSTGIINATQIKENDCIQTSSSSS